MHVQRPRVEDEVTYYKALLQHASDGLIVADDQRRIVFINRAAMELVEMSPDDPLPQTCGDLLRCHDENDKSLAFEALCFGRCVLERRASLDYVEMNVRTRSGKIVPVAVSYSYIPVGDKRYFLMSIRNLTERRHLEEERRKKDELYFTLKERERLARDLHDGVVQDIAYSHMQVKLVLSLLSQGRISEAQAKLEEVAGVIHDSFVELRHVLYDLTLHTGKELKQFLQKRIVEFQHRTGIAVEMADHNFPDHCDPYTGDQVAKIVQEALSNVRKHSGASKVWITLGTRPAGPFRCQYTVMIEDDGCGIPDEVLDQAHQPKADEDAGNQHFGLQAMRQRAQSLGGILKISRREPRGTKIELHWFQDAHNETVGQTG
ncbi:MAG: PAS domain S-box protein [Alicyclobacillaceae bacterium]|nr:PAS domain S-box protein [Alicyclobacillaceae bacterium]